jgi:hypothetical protein
MWLLAFAIYAACKLLTWISAMISATPGLKVVPPWRHAAYLLAWPGMDAASFLRTHASRRRISLYEWLRGLGKLGTGYVLLFGVARRIPPRLTYLIGWIGGLGIVLILHFGVFELLSCFWRSLGVDARPNMNRPMISKSVSEFWGRRWNTAFRDLTHRFVFRPLAEWLGPRAALLLGFAASGAIHDLVISIPARAGYGRPTVYFAIQGVALIFEHSALGRGLHLGSGAPGRIFTMAVITGPVCLLFHVPFIAGVIVPFMRATGALP